MFVSRSQAESPAESAVFSDAAVIECDPAEDKARQEFAEDADVNSILRRFGAGGFEARPVIYGEQDFGLDLDGVYAAAQASSAAWGRLPRAVRQRYPDWAALLAGFERGELEVKDGVLTPPAVPSAPLAPVAPVAPPA